MKGSIRVRDNGKYSYYFKYKDENEKWKTKEKGGFATKKEAQTAMRKAIRDFEEKGAIEKAVKYTFNQYTEYWFENVGEPNLTYNSIKTYRMVFDSYVKDEIGHLKLDGITPNILQKFFTKMNGRQLSDSTNGAVRNFLSNVFKLAVTQKALRENPLKSVVFQKARKKRKEKRVLNEGERNTILKAVEGTCYHAPTFIALCTGARRGEVLGLLWECVDFESNQIIINKQLQVAQKRKLVLTEPKTPSSIRTFQMPDRLNKYLRKLKTEQEKLKEFYKTFYIDGNYVCCKENGYPIAPTTLSAKMCLLKKETGIDFSFHDLRHTHATMMLEADVNIKVLQERLGHANISETLDTYSHVTKKLEDQAIERFNSFF